MPRLNKTLTNWHSTHLAATLQDEIRHCGNGMEVLQKASEGGHIDETTIMVTILGKKENYGHIEIRSGIFFSEMIGGCNCSEDPFQKNSYCEILIRIDKISAEADFSLLSD